MGAPAEARDHARCNRLLSISAGFVTIIAIVLAFASGYLGQQWQWLRPAGELLLLAELVGLVVLERHQLFEPVRGDVAETKGHVIGLMETLSSLTERLDLAGQATLHTGASEHFRTMAASLGKRQRATTTRCRSCG